MVSGVVPNVHAALIGCLLMGLFRCMDLPSAYRAISWKSLVLIVGMLPFSIALQRTGGVDLAADGVLAVAGEASPRLVLGDPLRRHRGARPVHLQHCDRGAHGARCPRHRGGYRTPRPIPSR